MEVQRDRKRINQPQFIAINRKLNELAGKEQSGYDRDIIRSIVAEVNAQEDATKAAQSLYYRTVKEHPFRGANRRTAALVSNMILLQDKKELKLPTISETQKINQRIRDERIPQAEFNRIMEDEWISKHVSVKKKIKV